MKKKEKLKRKIKDILYGIGVHTCDDVCNGSLEGIEETTDKLFSLLKQERQKVLEEVEKVLPSEEKSPPNIKQEIWGGERGYSPTKIESPDVLGIERVGGFNHCLFLIKNLLQSLKEEK